jgi:hypothetical protein
VCALRDALDRHLAAEWLTSSASRSSTLGVVCCRRHGWRLWEVAADAQPDAPSGTTLHAALRGRVRGALDHFAHALEHLQTRVRRGAQRDGRHDRLTERRPRGILWDLPACSLCARLAEDDPVLLHLVERDLAPRASGERAQLVAMLCPRDRLLCFAVLRTWPEIALPSYRTPVGWNGWWEPAKFGTSESSMAMRLAEAPASRAIPDSACPACWVRAEHERILVRDLLAEAEDAQQSDATIAMGSRAATAPSQPVGDDVCARHVALLRPNSSDVSGSPIGSVDPTARQSELPVPARWPTGTLRRQPVPQRCVLCAAEYSWDLARLEGLRRAAGSAALGEQMTAALRAALAQRTHGLCLPHWMRVTASAPYKVTQTLLDLELRSVHAIGAQLRLHEVRAGPGPGEHQDACAAAIAALAGYPA